MPESRKEPRPRFVVVGTGRSGTGYTARLLRACGLRAGHESVYGPAQAIRAAEPAWRDYDADCSWLAVPLLPLTLPVALVTRHPLPTVASMLRVGVFAPGRENDPYTRVYYTFAPAVAAQPGPADRALMAWLALTRYALDYAGVVVRLEDLRPDNPAGVREVVRLLGAVGAAGYGADAASALAETHANPEAFNLKPEHVAVAQQPGWETFNPTLAMQSRWMCYRLGYDPYKPPWRT